VGKKLPVILVLALAVVAQQLWTSGGALDYLDWEAGVAEAQATGKPILINFGGPW
jgi:hypothetical protein